MNHVTFETAKRLKEAGFLQPGTWTYGCVWYTPVLRFLLDDQHDAYIRDDGMCALMNRENSYYAPTATELLPDGWVMYKKDNGWEVMELYAVQPSPRFWHTNPHEAAALAALFVNSKQ